VSRGLFVTGTDTGVGKTLVAASLLRRARALGLRACGMKPVAAGARPGREHLCNEDVDALTAAGNVAAPLELVCPYLLREAVSPHIAAELEGRRVDLDHIEACYRQLAARADCVIVEGAGGWYAPLSGHATIASLARRLRLPVVLVVGLRLGCLNHALLAVRAIAADEVPLAGWIANCIDPAMAQGEANLAYLSNHIGAPLLGRIPWLGEGRDDDTGWLRHADGVLTT
jgi:dethiobiotin synthetase